MPEKILTWIVVAPFNFTCKDGTYIKPGGIFQATNAEVKRQGHKVRIYKDPEPEKPEPTSEPEPEKIIKKSKRGRPPKRTVNIAEAPEDRAM
jgi:hypothetical protein